MRKMTTTGRPGFSLIETLVLVAMLIVLATVITPSLVTSLDRARIQRAIDLLAELQADIATFETDVGESPSSMTQLIEPITNNDPDLCGRSYSGAESGGWAGPYLGRVLAGGEAPVAIGDAQDGFVHTTDGGGADELRIVVEDVTPADADRLDALIDSDGDAGAGTVQYSAPGPDGLVTLEYVLPGTCTGGGPPGGGPPGGGPPGG